MLRFQRKTLVASEYPLHFKLLNDALNLHFLDIRGAKAKKCKNILYKRVIFSKYNFLT